MKNTIIILFILISFNCFSQVKLESGFGLFYSTNEAYKVNNTIFEMNNITMLNQMRLSKNNFMIVSNISIMMNKTEGKVTFTPSLASFDLDFRYFCNKFIFSIAHRCVHPISTNNKPLEFSIYGGYDLKFKILYNIK